MSESQPESTVHTHIDLTEKPPSTLLGILRRLGPGLIVAGSIVGSGELIATTATGAKAGFALLWLIVIGCVIKVFVQVELGRYTIVSGKATIGALNEVPGPRIRGGGNWIVWFWFFMFLASIAQLGGIVGGVGQALAISSPLTSYGYEYNQYVEAETQLSVNWGRLERIEDPAERIQVFAETERLRQELLAMDAAWISQHGEQAYDAEKQWQFINDTGSLETRRGHPVEPLDSKYWAAVIALITVVVLVYGRYGLIQSFSTAMVAMFTLVTMVNLFWLQTKPDWSVSWSELLHGLSFSLPQESAGGTADAISTALKAFGIIGVGASELISYPYWCLEKGYARFTGPRQETEAWASRARGWLRVMQYDAWGSMLVYTFATIAFYLLGAATLGRIGQSPEGNETIRTLAVMYEPVFGATAQILFLFGAFAVLYSTFFVANASHARVVSDAIGVLGFVSTDDTTRRRWVKRFSALFPLTCLVIFVAFPKPVVLVLLSGMMQAFMLPMLAFAALFYRYKRNDPRLPNSRIWDVFLWLSSLGMLIVGVWLFYGEITKVYALVQTFLTGGGS